jgi:hypothetical protein
MMRTPKVGETWVWKACDRHQFKQLRDVTVEGRDFEDQPDFLQEEILQHIRCGCRYPADDPEQAVRDLRRDEDLQRMEMLLTYYNTLHPEKPEIPFPWFIFLWLLAIAALLFLILPH